MKNYAIIILISALFLSTLIFALPQTENIIPTIDDKRFDLEKKENEYWKHELILQLNIDPKNRSLREEKVSITKDILYKRLQQIGVEEIQIVNYEVDTEVEDYVTEYIKVTIQTTKEESTIGRILQSTGDVRIMVPKDDIHELSTEDEMALYSPENYESTRWNRDDFRTILINDLLAGDGQRSYFGIFKPSMGNRGEFSNFLKEHENQFVGVLMDSFVMPVEVGDQQLNDVFAVGLGPDTGEAELQNIILNTGVIPVVDIFIIQDRELEPDVYKVDHIQVTLAILASILSLLFFLYQRDKEEKERVAQFAFSLALIFSISLTILKIWQIPVDLFLLIPTGILGAIFVKKMYTCTTESKMILITTVAISAIMILLGTGYIPIMGSFLLAVILISFVSEILTKTYFKNIKEINGYN